MEINLLHELYKDLPEITIGNRIHKARIMKGMTQQELADAAGLKRGSIDTFEFGDAFPSIKTMKAIAKALDIPFSYFKDEYYSFVEDGFHKRIKEWRTNKGLSIRAAAKVLKVNERTILSWEHGEYVMNRVTYEKCKGKMIEEA